MRQVSTALAVGKAWAAAACREPAWVVAAAECAAEVAVAECVPGVVVEDVEAAVVAGGRTSP